MKQVIQDYLHGRVRVDEVPTPLARDRGVLVRTRSSLVSAGTERAVLDFGSKGLVAKARSRPDLVRQVVQKVRSDGLLAAYKASVSRLEVPLALGYSSSGEVIEVGRSVTELQVGDRVACAGGGYAAHAEVVYVPRNLVVRVPGNVSDEEAAFTTIGAIALHGVRLAGLSLGERVVVIGLGLLGLLTVQLVKAAGCMVLGAELNPDRVKLALDLYAKEAVVAQHPDAVREAVMAFTGGRGADAVIITAATRSNAPTELAGEVSRLKGRVVAVGEVGMDIPRRTYYRKELEYRLSMSYGPGRYDPTYEEKGIDYPYAYVPFTEQRNMAAFLELVAQGMVTPSRLVTHRFPITEADKAYRLVAEGDPGSYLGIVLSYPTKSAIERRVDVNTPRRVSAQERCVRLGLVGAGNHARLMLLPHLVTLKGVDLVGVATATGPNAKHTATKYGFEFCATDSSEVLSSKDINAVLIATRHQLHAGLTIQAVECGKHVFVEKPLAVNEGELSRLVEVVGHSRVIVMVGFNRRFAPLVAEAKAAFAKHAGPLSMIYRVNAGAIPSDHWTQDREEGAGRVIGEVCHFLDLLQFICSSRPEWVYAAPAGRGQTAAMQDNLSITIRFEDGSIGTIAYFSTGDKRVPKEYIELFGDGKTVIIDDFRSARFASEEGLRAVRPRGRDKGQRAGLSAFVDAILSGEASPVPFDEAVVSTLATFRILDSLRSRREVPVCWSEGEEPAPVHGRSDAPGVE